MREPWSFPPIQMPKGFTDAWARRASAKFDPKSKASRAYCRACRLILNTHLPLREGPGVRARSVWDLKRQIIWLVVGVSFGTFIIYGDAHDETGHFERGVFAFWEIILLTIILTLFFLYSRQTNY